MTVEEPKSFLIIGRKAPVSSYIAQESVDAALAAAAFGQRVSLLLMDDGVFQLLPQQDSSALEQKNIAKLLPMLAMYDVNEVYVEQASLTARGLSTKDFCIPAQPLDTANLTSLIAESDVVLSF